MLHSFWGNLFKYESMKKIYLTICLSIIYFFTQAQDRAIHFVHDSVYSFGSLIYTLSDGNLIVGGSIYDPKTEKTIPFLSKISADAKIIWYKNYPNGVISSPSSGIVEIIELANGNLIAVVNTYYLSNEPYAICLDTNGNDLWRLNLNIATGYIYQHSACSIGNDFFLTMNTGIDLSILKLDESGKVLWAKSIENLNSSESQDFVRILPFDNKLLVAYGMSNFTQKKEYTELVTLNPINGNLLAKKKLEAVNDTLIFQNIKIIDNQVFISAKNSNNSSVAKPILLTLDNNFDVKKAEKFTPNNSNYGYTFLQVEKFDNDNLVGLARNTTDDLPFGVQKQGFFNYNLTSSNVKYYGVMPNWFSIYPTSQLAKDKDNYFWTIGGDLSANTGLLKSKAAKPSYICSSNEIIFSKIDINIKISTPTWTLKNYTFPVAKTTLKTEIAIAKIVDNCLHCSVKENKIKLQLCANQKFKTPSGKIFTQSGIYKDTAFNSTIGCFGFYEYDYKLKPSSSQSIQKFLCATTPSITIALKTYTKEGIYTDTLKTKTGCDSILNITINSLADFKVSLGEDKEIIEGEKLLLNAESNYTNIIKNYTWFPAGTSTCDTCRSISVAPSQNQWFAVKADINGCFASDSINIKVLNEKLVFIPNAFSPNNDQNNDLFRPFTAEAVEEIEYLIVYDRWGNHIYEAVNFLPNDEKTGWNGTAKGEIANIGVYTYAVQVRLRNGKTQRYIGDVMLVR